MTRFGIPPPKLVAPDLADEAFNRYLAACNDYLKRQILVYQNWPQRRFGAMGYLEEKVFADMNA